MFYFKVNVDIVVNVESFSDTSDHDAMVCDYVADTLRDIVFDWAYITQPEKYDEGNYIAHISILFASENEQTCTTEIINKLSPCFSSCKIIGTPKLTLFDPIVFPYAEGDFMGHGSDVSPHEWSTSY